MKGIPHSPISDRLIFSANLPILALLLQIVKENNFAFRVTKMGISSLVNEAVDNEFLDARDISKFSGDRRKYSSNNNSLNSKTDANQPTHIHFPGNHLY